MARRLCVLTLPVAVRLQAQQTPAKPALGFEEVMIPVRDGVHLQTVILTPSDKTGPLPILFRRTPYGVPDKRFRNAGIFGERRLSDVVRDGVG